MKSINIVIPARQEAATLPTLLESLGSLVDPEQIIVVDDASSDATASLCQEYGVVHLRHPYNLGNGAAIKTGCRHAMANVLVLMDADGQHDPVDVRRLVEKLDEGYDMAVGARAPSSHASLPRRLANAFYNRLASWMTGHRIDDLTSGFRAVRTERFREFLYLLPNGFSYPTTITMAFFRSGYPVAYVPIVAGRRSGTSHIKPLRDGLRFLLIIFKVGTLYSPMKLFGPVSLFFFLLGAGYYTYTFIADHRFTNMSALLLTTSVIIFLIGLVSEQITSLLYRRE
ncbi:glycosyltransferase involved in cell wall biosynthesis [Plasticicumulans lactativorans]|uniref:Glycosyltransferase involved in cell wall biosynthesis n=1 Tax=Plasticicumulans lactativorans TaxID=1133106 RepID=A0A4R2LBL5_9GAMM|nr:glycosyltransferase family 2 protein [Plasticicumulans lactativorans]TCO80198.1 glycosyltransferase involved in cell wall biosynthesis [Plasticicumulans lactativorans]